MTNTEYLSQIATKLGVDVTQLPDNLVTTYLAAILAALGSGGTGGGSGAPLYMHNIRLWDEWNNSQDVYVTIYNTDPTDYTSLAVFDDNGFPVSMADMTKVINAIIGKGVIPASGYFDTSMCGNQINAMVTGISANSTDGLRLNYNEIIFDDGSISPWWQSVEFENIQDTVTRIM